MPLHRVIEVATFVPPDPSWSQTQAAPVLDPLPVGTTYWVPVVARTGLWRIFWWGVGYDGPGEGANPVDSTGITWDAAMVLARPSSGTTVFEYVRLTSIAEALGGTPIEAGRASVELDLPGGVQAYLRIIDYNHALAATHFHIKYAIRQVNG